MNTDENIFKNIRAELPNTITYWEEGSADTKKNFNKNKKRLGKDWIYNKKNISYINNELGFRTKSMTAVDWANSIVIFGCSIIKGTGLAIEDTIGYRLERVLNIPVISLGISGSGIDLACCNSVILHDHYPYPKAIVQVWSELGRYSDQTRTGIYSYMPNRKNYNATYDWERRSKFYVKTDRALWKNKTIYYEGSLFEYTAKSLNIDFYKQIDSARDLTHPGIKSHEGAANGIAKKLLELGI